MMIVGLILIFVGASSTAGGPTLGLPGMILLWIGVSRKIKGSKVKRHGIAFIVTFAIQMIAFSMQEQSRNADTNRSAIKSNEPISASSAPNTPKPVVHNENINIVLPYTIINTDDISIKAITKAISQYSTSELTRLPVNLRIAYRIVVPSDISKDDLKKAMIRLVEQETNKNSDIDEIVIFAYDRKEDTAGVYTFGKMEWCPNGEWEGVTPNIASSNDRSSYKYIFSIRDKVGNNSNDLVPTDEERRIYDIYTKALDKHENMEEDAVKEMIARQLQVPTTEIDRICIKMLANTFR